MTTNTKNTNININTNTNLSPTTTTNNLNSDDIKKALVIIKSRPEVPFVSDTEEVKEKQKFI